MATEGECAEVCAEKPRSGRGCWYFIHVSECVLCSYGTVDRERRWDERPERWEDRHNFRQDACGYHFM